MASSTIPLRCDTSGWDYARAQARLQRFASVVRWALTDAGCVEGRAYYGPPAPIEQAGFLLCGITPEAGRPYVEVSHYAAPGTDCRAACAAYRAALDAAGLDCGAAEPWGYQDGRYYAPGLAPPDTACYYVAFPVYPPARP